MPGKLLMNQFQGEQVLVPPVAAQGFLHHFRTDFDTRVSKCRQRFASGSPARIASTIASPVAPLISLSGHRPIQEANAEALRYLVKSGPISPKRVCAMPAPSKSQTGIRPFLSSRTVKPANPPPIWLSVHSVQSSIETVIRLVIGWHWFSLDFEDQLLGLPNPPGAFFRTCSSAGRASFASGPMSPSA